MTAPSITTVDGRLTTVTDARARLRAWSGNRSIDEGAWLGDVSTAWAFYEAIHRARAERGLPPVPIEICFVEDDREGNRAPYSSDASVILRDYSPTEWRLPV